jgi:hypothetical protein
VRVSTTGLAVDQLGSYVPTVDAVVVVVSPGDDTEVKIPWYLGRAVREVWKTTPAGETVEVVGSGGSRPRSDVFDLSVADTRALLGWT